MRSRAALLIAISALLGGCRGDRCSSADVGCFLEHLVLAEPRNDGALLPLVAVEGTITPAPPGGCSGSACDGRCVNLAFDDANCGACGATCQGGTHCLQGSCACPANKQLCNGICVDPSSDPLHCGVCGQVCQGQRCSGGSCVEACEDDGKTPCGFSCVDTKTDPNNCGGCGVACVNGETCVDGACSCTNPPLGCGCVDPSNDPNNCGGCFVQCAAGEACVGGVCASNTPVAPSTPSIVNKPPPMAFDDPSELKPLRLTWSDPNSCGPAFCFQLCDDFACSSGFQCTSPESGDAGEGAFDVYLGFLAKVSAGDVHLRMGILPISAAGCPADLISRVAAGDAAALAGVGQPTTIPIAIGEGATPELPTIPGAGQCFAPLSACDCSVRPCTAPSGKCWFDTPVGRFDCGPGCDCAEASSQVVTACCPAP